LTTTLDSSLPLWSDDLHRRLLRRSVNVLDVLNATPDDPTVFIVTACQHCKLYPANDKASFRERSCTDTVVGVMESSTFLPLRRDHIRHEVGLNDLRFIFIDQGFIRGYQLEFGRLPQSKIATIGVRARIFIRGQRQDAINNRGMLQVFFGAHFHASMRDAKEM
ncbi:hypothetical protein KCU73_g5, partial [Aureobasidium melanogenum]